MSTTPVSSTTGMEKVPGRRMLILLAALCLVEAVPFALWMTSSIEGWPAPAVPPAASLPASAASSHDPLCTGIRKHSVRDQALSQEYRMQMTRLRNSSRMLKSEPNGLQLWSTPRGAVWVPQEDGDTLFLILAEQGIGLYDAWQTRIRKGDVVLDVGAHVGLFTREALAAGAGRVIAMEPVPAHIECLRRNLRDEIRSGRVTIYEKGAWDRDEVLPMRALTENSGSASFVLERREGVAVARGAGLPLTTIDKMAFELQVARIDFIKMDIEGAEERALLGAGQIISRDRPRIVACVYHRPQDRDVIPAAVRKAAPDHEADYRCLDSGTGLEAKVAFLSRPEG